MPPKPWETQTDVQNTTTLPTTTQPESSDLTSTNPNQNSYSPYQNNYNSPYSGYSGYGGGYSGYGGMYGGGMYGGGMYGGGMYGRQPGDPNGFMERGLRFLDSFGYITNGLCEVSRYIFEIRNLEMNSDGLGRLFVSLKGLLYKLTFGTYENGKNLIKFLQSLVE